jgi:hypothetical protein
MAHIGRWNGHCCETFVWRNVDRLESPQVAEKGQEQQKEHVHDVETANDKA